jgi:hypothetical protein
VFVSVCVIVYVSVCLCVSECVVFCVWVSESVYVSVCGVCACV